MGNVTEKLQYIADTKTAIKNALISAGAIFADGLPFRQYADVISQLWQIWSNVTALNLVTEGHSFLADGSRMNTLLKNGVVNSDFYNGAVSGSQVYQVEARKTVTISKFITETVLTKNFLVLWIGVNDMDNTAGCGTTTFNAVKSYIDDIVAANCTVFAYTVTPSTAAGRSAVFEAERDIFNGLLRNIASNRIIILDTDTISELDNPANTTYYLDALHPANPGCALAFQLFANKLISLAAPQLLISPIELVINGGFDADSDWLKSVGNSIADGVCHFIGVTQFIGITQSNIFTPGKTYTVVFTILNYVGGVVMFDDNIVGGAQRSADGTFTETFTPSGTDFIIRAYASTATLDIDNVSVKEVV